MCARTCVCGEGCVLPRQLCWMQLPALQGFLAEPLGTSPHLGTEVAGAAGGGGRG